MMPGGSGKPESNSPRQRRGWGTPKALVLIQTAGKPTGTVTSGGSKMEPARDLSILMRTNAPSGVSAVALTVIAPVSDGCRLQWYSKLPSVSNVLGNSLTPPTSTWIPP